ncbi:MAG: Adenylate kinase [candidate division WWE3 bacterium GW2011_GWB1_42_6]|uniref:Adenylate kinase n=1 Tax=candidate division WWE3 bacterium GW2011_GWB1_42_6 TaxID=1619115 RepID=A0A0G1AXJ8_UNCKA|nr:MAG: Adenylate kinase [candidate division WWE3 bacterium GW2011_GWB1_42_6]
MNIILLGSPGSGKGTQAEMLAKKLDLFCLQTGDLSREWAEKDARINAIVDGGKLIPEKEMTEYVMKYLEEKVPSGANILFEGFPRFIPQYVEYEKWLASKGQRIDAAKMLR